jgi:DNA-binding winged helix-turn-helix (wHTH) protein
VDWQPFLPPNHLRANQIVVDWIDNIFDACARALVRFWGHHPARYTAAAHWVQETLLWFIQTYFQGDLEILLSRMEAEITHEGVTSLAPLLQRKARPALYAGAQQIQVIAELASVIRQLGLQGGWLMVDGFEPWLNAELDPMSEPFHAFLSTLGLFERPEFALKIVAPDVLAPALTKTGGVQRRRLHLQRLGWEPAALQTIIERRLAAQLQRPQARLVDLCEGEAFGRWLAKYGGATPRGWLELVRPYVYAYLSRRMKRPLPVEAWKEIQQRYPPLLRIDLLTSQVFIGGREVTGLQPMPLKVLRYLYEQRPRICTRSELYYRVMRGLSREPRSAADEGWESSASWSGALDSLVWRLRQSLKDEGEHYLVTERGRGIRLKNVW